MFLTLADIQAFINFVNGNLGKKMFTDALPTATVAGQKLITTGVGLGVELVDDISTQLGIAGTWDMSTLLPPTGVKIGERYFVGVAGTFNGVPALAGDIVEFTTLVDIFVYPLADTLVRLPALDDYATKLYAESLVVGLIDDRGGYDPTITSGYPTSANNGSGTAGAVLKGDLWFFVSDGICGANTVLTGYSVRALVDNPGQTDSNWNVLNVGLGYVPENVANKKTSLNGALSSPNDTDYPSTLVVDDALNLKADILDQTHTGAMRLPSSLKIYDTVAPTKEVAVDVSDLTAGAPRTVTFPDRDIALGDLPLFAATTNYRQYAIIQQDGLLYSAKVAFTSGASFSVSDWDSIGGILKSQITASQDIVSGYEYFIVASPNVAITLETPDPTEIPDGSRIVIHNLAFNAVATLGKTNWNLGTGFAVAPSFDTVATATIPSYSNGATTVLTSRQSTGVWVKETTYGSTIPVGTSTASGKAYFAREDEVTATVSLNLGAVPAATNRIVTYPNRDITLGSALAYANGSVYTVGAEVTYLGKLYICNTAHTSSTAAPDFTKFYPADGVLVAAIASGTYTPPVNANIQEYIVLASGSITYTTGLVGVTPVTFINTSGSTITVTGNPDDLNEGPYTNTLSLDAGEQATARDLVFSRTGQTVNSGRFKIRQPGTNGWYTTFSLTTLTGNNVITVPNFNVDLGKIVSTYGYVATTGVLTFTNTDTTTATVNLPPIQWTNIVANTASTTMVAGLNYIASNTATGKTYTLPASPSIGQVVQITSSTFTAFNQTVARNGQTIDGVAANFTLSRNGTYRFFFNASSTWETSYTTLSGINQLLPGFIEINPNGTTVLQPNKRYYFGDVGSALSMQPSLTLPTNPAIGDTVEIHDIFNVLFTVDSPVTDGGIKRVILTSSTANIANFFAASSSVTLDYAGSGSPTLAPISLRKGAVIYVSYLPCISGLGLGNVWQVYIGASPQSYTPRIPLTQINHVAHDASGGVTGSVTLAAPLVTGDRVLSVPNRSYTIGTLPAFSATTYYEAGAVIQNAGNIYKATIAFTSGASFSSANWTQVVGKFANLLAQTGSQTLAIGGRYALPVGWNSTLALSLPTGTDGDTIEIADPYNVQRTLTGGNGVYVTPQVGQYIQYSTTASTDIVGDLRSALAVLLTYSATNTRWELSHISRNVPMKNDDNQEYYQDGVLVRRKGCLYVPATAFLQAGGFVSTDWVSLGVHKEAISANKTLIVNSSYYMRSAAPGTPYTLTLPEPYVQSFSNAIDGAIIEIDCFEYTGTLSFNTSLWTNAASNGATNGWRQGPNYEVDLTPVHSRTIQCAKGMKIRFRKVQIGTVHYWFIDLGRPSDSAFSISDSTDSTRLMGFNASAIAAGQRRVITMPDANVNLGDLLAFRNFNGNTTTNNGTILSRGSSNSAANGVVLLSGNSLKAGFNYPGSSAVVVRTGDGGGSRPAVVDTILTDFASGLSSNPLTLTGEPGLTAKQPFAAAPAGSEFWTLGGGNDTIAVHTLTFACSVFGALGFRGVFSGQRRIMVRRLNATDTYIIENVQTIGTDVGTTAAAFTGISVAVTLTGDKMNIVVSHTTAGIISPTLFTSADLHTLVTSLG